MKTLFVALLGATVLTTVAACANAQTRAVETDSLRLYYVGRAVGWEHYSLEPEGDGLRLSSDLDYIDRGRRNHVQSTMALASDYAPRHLEVARVNDTTRTLVARVDVDGRRTTVTRWGQTTSVDLSGPAFAISAYTPVSQHLALVRYWRAHGSPRTMIVVPGGPTNPVSIRRETVVRLERPDGGGPLTLACYAIDGVVWGTEYLWLDANDRFAMFASAAGGLSFKAVRADLVPMRDRLMKVATDAAISDLRKLSARTPPMMSGSIALVGARLIDGRADTVLESATVIVVGDRIVAVGPSASTPIPASARTIDVRGKTIVPGLWDMHAHLHQIEWIPAYMAAGVTTVRDMGNELPFITALRKAITSEHVNGPNIFMAGLIDGPGPNGFGEFSASTPEEGRAIVRRYHALGFEQMKLYNLLPADVVGAVCREAHALGMTVTGHIPNALTLLAAVDSGMDHVAHLPLRGDPQSDSLKATLAHLRAHGTVLDPTASWGEIGGHSTAEPLENFQPGVLHMPAPFVQFRAAGWGSPAIDSATAHQRLARTLAIIRAAHDAGIPIVAGTDEGVPGFSVYREIELYVKAGFTPTDAIKSATSVSATAMRVDADVGTVAAGKRADLLVLDANPLENIANIRSVRFVMKDGRLYDDAALWRGAGFTP